jgi:histidyl-tRNA synthetase
VLNNKNGGDMAKVNLARGMRDILPSALRRRRKVIQTIEKVFESFGFEALETPAVERIETLMGKYGDEGNKLIFRILARGKGGEEGRTDLALRYDLTVPLARVVAMNQQLVLPFKRYQIQPVWRADRPQRGRFREFFQCDVDVVGTENILAEAECLTIVHQSLVTLGFEAFKIRLNDRNILRAMVEQIGAGEREVAVLVAIDKLDKISEEGVRNLLLKEEFSADQVDALFEMLNTGKINGIESELANLEAIKEMAVAMGVDSERLVIDFTLARGLDYYTGPVFETIFTDDNIGSISGGGRYDGLIGKFGKKNIPAVGVSLGLERLITIMEERGMLSEDSAVDLWVTVFDAELQKETLEIAQEFRKAGVRTMVSMRSGKLGKQFKDANKAGAKWVVVYGSDDKEKGVVLLKNLEKGEQYSVPLAEAVQKVLEA